MARVGRGNGEGNQGQAEDARRGQIIFQAVFIPRTARNDMYIFKSTYPCCFFNRRTDWKIRLGRN